MKLQDEFEDQGFKIIGNHVQRVDKAKVLGLLRRVKANFSVYSFGRIQATKTSNGIPYMYLFNGSGELVDHGHLDDVRSAVKNLLDDENHWILRGKSFNEIDDLAKSLKRSKSWTSTIKKLEGHIKKAGSAESEAKYMLKQIMGYGRHCMKKAEALEKEDLLAAHSEYVAVSKRYSGHELGKSASARAKAVKKNKAFSGELKAAKYAAAIEAELAKLINSGGKTALDYGPNKRISARAMSMFKSLYKKYPDAAATKRVRAVMEEAGFKFS